MLPSETRRLGRPEIVVVDHVRVDEKVVVESSVNLQNPVHRHLGHSGHSRLATHQVKAQDINIFKDQVKAARPRCSKHNKRPLGVGGHNTNSFSLSHKVCAVCEMQVFVHEYIFVVKPIARNLAF